MLTALQSSSGSPPTRCPPRHHSRYFSVGVTIRPWYLRLNGTQNWPPPGGQPPRSSPRQGRAPRCTSSRYRTGWSCLSTATTAPFSRSWRRLRCPRACQARRRGLRLTRSVQKDWPKSKLWHQHDAASKNQSHRRGGKLSLTSLNSPTAPTSPRCRWLAPRAARLRTTRLPVRTQHLHVPSLRSAWQLFRRPEGTSPCPPSSKDTQRLASITARD